jgi:hypothetical protein
MHFDDRVVDAVFERTLFLVILSSFDCLSPHSEGATFYLILSVNIDSDRIKTTTNHNHHPLVISIIFFSFLTIDGAVTAQSTSDDDYVPRRQDTV